MSGVKLNRAQIRSIFKNEARPLLDAEAQRICNAANASCSADGHGRPPFACGGGTGQVSYHATVYPQTKHGRYASQRLADYL